MFLISKDLQITSMNRFKGSMQRFYARTICKESNGLEIFALLGLRL
jgi:hypothetical protein